MTRRSRRPPRVGKVLTMLLAPGLVILAVLAVVTLPAARTSHRAMAIVSEDAAVTSPTRIPVHQASSALSHHSVPPNPPVVRTPTPAPTSTTAPAIAAATKSTIAPAAPPTTTAAPTVSPLAAQCAVALAYLAAHAKPGFAHYCRPAPLHVGIAHAVAFTCVPGTGFTCPDGVPEIIIADPGCAISYENEASNSYWDFSTGGVITPSTVQAGRTWDPYGSCP